MPYSGTHDFYDGIIILLKKVSDRIPLNRAEQKALKGLLDRWHSTVCPEAGCRPERCPFARPLDWVEYHGHARFCDLINSLDTSEPITSLPERRSIDPLSASWALRPGHYNP